jgi:hypothetical protein
MLPYAVDGRPHLVLQDFDKAAKSNLSTCLLLWAADLLKPKVRASRAASRPPASPLRWSNAGSVQSPNNGRRADHGALRRRQRRRPPRPRYGRVSLVVETGLGSGYRDFRNIRLHTFPGPRLPSQIWTAESTAQAAAELNDAYKKLADERKDICGMTLLASRAVATPFVGALAGGAGPGRGDAPAPRRLGLCHPGRADEEPAPSHRRSAHAPYQGLQTAFVQVEKRPAGSCKGGRMS